jgi:hypothetical protein
MDTTEIDLLKQKVRENLDLAGVTIPEEIKISTMTMDAKLDVKFNATNIYKYIRTSKEGIVRIKPITKKAKKDKKPKNSQQIRKRKNVIVEEKKKKNSEEFLNQVTVYVNVSQKNDKNPVSVKIFRNGTLHFTGVVSIASLLEATYKICEECKRKRAIVVQTKNPDGTVTERIEKIDFVDDVSKLDISNLFDFAVSMINCNFKVPFKVDRPKLLVSMSSDGYNVAYDSNGHSAVNIKYQIQKKESVSKGIRVRNIDDLGKNKERVTIFVFESGSIIIILGNQGFRPINEVYTFIYKYLLVNYDTIVKDDELTDSSIREYLEESEYKNTITVHKGTPNSTAYMPKKKQQIKTKPKAKTQSNQKQVPAPSKKSLSRSQTKVKSYSKNMKVTSNKNTALRASRVKESQQMY